MIYEQTTFVFEHSTVTNHSFLGGLAVFKSSSGSDGAQRMYQLALLWLLFITIETDRLPSQWHVGVEGGVAHLGLSAGLTWHDDLP